MQDPVRRRSLRLKVAGEVIASTEGATRGPFNLESAFIALADRALACSARGRKFNAWQSCSFASTTSLDRPSGLPARLRYSFPVSSPASGRVRHRRLRPRPEPGVATAPACGCATARDTADPLIALPTQASRLASLRVPHVLRPGPLMGFLVLVKEPHIAVLWGGQNGCDTSNYRNQVDDLHDASDLHSGSGNRPEPAPPTGDPRRGAELA